MSKSDKTASPKQVQISQRRVLIIETAIECFIKKGFHKTSVRDIAKLANISLGNFYNYFESKNALIEEIALIEAEEIKWVNDLQMAPQNPEVVLETFINRYLAHVETLPNVVLTIEILAEAIRNPEIGKQYSTNRRKLTEAVIQILTLGYKQTQFNRDLDKTEAAILILDMIEGLAMRSVLTGKRSTKKAKHTLKMMIINAVSN